MEQLRVVDLAHTMGITAKELIFKLRSIGVNVTSEEDALDLSTVRSIITGETLQRRPAAQKRQPRAQPRITSTARRSCTGSVTGTRGRGAGTRLRSASTLALPSTSQKSTFPVHKSRRKR